MTTSLAQVEHAVAAMHPSHAVSTWLTPNSFERAMQITELMLKMATMPEHLRGKREDCFRIVVQSAKWQMDPFAVAECTSLVHGRLCYEGKLVHAVLMSMGAIGEPLDFEFDGTGQLMSVKVTGKLRRSGIVKSLSGTVKDWRTTTKTKEGNTIPNGWDKDPASMLAYRGTRQWARLYAPDAMMGIVTPDEADDIKTVEASVVPEVKPAQARPLPPEVVAEAREREKEETQATAVQTGPLFTPAELSKRAHDIVNTYGTKGVTEIVRFRDAIGVQRVVDCPVEKVDEGMKLLAQIEADLASQGKRA